MKNVRILLAGGGTGGHVLPLVAVARAIKKAASDAKVYFIGPEEFPLDCLREEGVIVKKIIAAGKVRRYFSPLYIWELMKLPLAALESLIKVWLINPDVVLGKGSYGSVLPILAARLLGKKIVLHESDVVPGLANKFLAHWTDTVIVSFSESLAYFRGRTSEVIGNPVRLRYLNLDKTEASKILNLITFLRSYEIDNIAQETLGRKKIIFISGGSQGAQRINDAVLGRLDELLQNYFVIWSCGANNLLVFEDRIREMRNDARSDLQWRSDLGNYLRIAPLLSEKELAAAYVLCDIVIGRAGSGTIFEAAAFGKPAILIPIESAGNHQLYNAQAYAQIGAAKIIRELELKPETFVETLNDLMTNDSLLREMSRNARKFAKIEAAEQLARILLMDQSRI